MKSYAAILGLAAAFSVTSTYEPMPRPVIKKSSKGAPLKSQRQRRKDRRRAWAVGDRKAFTR